ncbi:uncharacterized protein MYCFIDRAFT_196544 [Pseudocercospora fijiensis CIRAD86]|uniref:Major facilitator superfamily (MFS) profile domain-containing protein n=1 Tax=Pseudocercospora fijiensis (strain CIRAD86) TaxID=383855 RepID=M2Z009_PSEFD|nr:uncharacterized protein MYCFIDRAFT_196544 [Pseudocercospora fijiensis CIRAD86]EME83195.1 hypothetical protein MYCFIDRAFT_196544 [Pseudocercospora fijiensis CIRAD86]
MAKSLGLILFYPQASPQIQKSRCALIRHIYLSPDPREYGPFKPIRKSKVKSTGVEKASIPAERPLRIAAMGLLEKFLPKEGRFAALLLYGMVFCTCFNGELNQLPSREVGIDSISSIRRWYHDCDLGMASLLIRCSVLQSVSNTYAVLIVGRLITGLGFGSVYIATNLYVAECSPRLLRGSFVGTVSQFGYQLGTLIAFWTGYGMSFHTHHYNIAWRVSNVIQIPIGLMFIVVSFWYIESPRWLLEKHSEVPERSLQALARLRSASPTDERVRNEFHEMVASHEYRRNYDTGYMGIFKSAAMRKRLAYGFYAMYLQQFGGIAALTMYATLIYQSLGWDKGSQALAINGIQAVLQLFIVLINTFTVDRFGRKQLLIAGFAIQSTALLILSSLTTAFPRNNNNKAAAVVEVAMFFIVGLTYCWSNGPVTPAIASKIFPQHVRDKAFGLSALGQSICLIALTQPWPRFNDEVGPKSYWLLFSLNVVAIGKAEDAKAVHAMEGETVARTGSVDVEKESAVNHIGIHPKA